MEPNVHEGFIVLDYLYDNREYLQDKIAPIKYMKENSLCTIPQVFHEDVMNQYLDTIYKMVTEEVAIATKVDAETIMITLEGFDLKGYLNG
jgi:hypothetical protein